MNCSKCNNYVEYDDLIYENDDAKDDGMLCIDCFGKKIKLCMSCGSDDDLINDMYCEDCDKRQRFMHIFDDSSCYKLGSYFGKHILEKHLGYYVSETEFIAFMLVRGYKFDEKKRCFRVKINKKRAYNILGFYI